MPVVAARLLILLVLVHVVVGVWGQIFHASKDVMESGSTLPFYILRDMPSFKCGNIITRC